jgi:hypothetical protein
MPRKKAVPTTDDERDAFAQKKLDYDRCQLVEKVEMAVTVLSEPLHPEFLNRAKREHAEAVEELEQFDAVAGENA